MKLGGIVGLVLEKLSKFFSKHCIEIIKLHQGSAEFVDFKFSPEQVLNNYLCSPGVVLSEFINRSVILMLSGR